MSLFGQNKTFSFGGTTTTTPSTGGFGTTQTGTAQNTTFSFGAAKPATGTTATTTTGFGGFGGFGTQSQQPTTGTGGGGLFGSTASATGTQPQQGGLFGTTPTTGFGSGSTTQPATGTGGGGLFGSTASGTGTQPQQGGLFGTTPTTGFGSGSSTQPTTGTGGGGLFGTTTFNFNTPQVSAPGTGSTTTFNLLGSSNVQQSNFSVITPQSIDILMNSLVSGQTFNDDRDLILAKWNQLQAFYGFGKIFYQNNLHNFTDGNQLTRFKTIGYSCKPSSKNEDGLVCLVIKDLINDIKSNQNKIIETLSKIFGSNPSFEIEIDSIKSLANQKDKIESNSLVTFYIIQRAPTGQIRRIPSLEVYNYLNKQETQTLGTLATKPTIKQQLDQIKVTNFYPLVQLNEEQIKEYLEKPPNDINPILWEQAKRNNPNQNKLIPVPIIGFQELNKRFKLQDQESQAQRSCLFKIKDDIDEINTKNKLLITKIEQSKHKNEELDHRLLKVMINYEIRRKLGICFQEDEKYIRNVLESLYIELSSPINKEIQKQKFIEFTDIIKNYELTQMKKQQQQQQQIKQNDDLTILNKNNIDLKNVEDIQKSLREQHKIFKSLIEIINKDLNDINIIKRNLQA